MHFPGHYNSVSLHIKILITVSKHLIKTRLEAELQLLAQESMTKQKRLQFRRFSVRVWMVTTTATYSGHSWKRPGNKQCIQSNLIMFYFSGLNTALRPFILVY
jgi:hypothetical protein